MSYFSYSQKMSESFRWNNVSEINSFKMPFKNWKISPGWCGSVGEWSIPGQGTHLG